MNILLEIDHNSPAPWGIGYKKNKPINARIYDPLSNAWLDVDLREIGWRVSGWSAQGAQIWTVRDIYCQLIFDHLYPESKLRFADASLRVRSNYPEHHALFFGQFIKKTPKNGILEALMETAGVTPEALPLLPTSPTEDRYLSCRPALIRMVRSGAHIRSTDLIAYIERKSDEISNMDVPESLKLFHPDWILGRFGSEMEKQTWGQLFSREADADDPFKFIDRNEEGDYLLSLKSLRAQNLHETAPDTFNLLERITNIIYPLRKAKEILSQQARYPIVNKAMYVLTRGEVTDRLMSFDTNFQNLSADMITAFVGRKDSWSLDFSQVELRFALARSMQMHQHLAGLAESELSSFGLYRESEEMSLDTFKNQLFVTISAERTPDRVFWQWALNWSFRFLLRAGFDREDGLLTCFVNDGDPHAMTGGVSPDDDAVTANQKRKRGKTDNLSMIYGVSPRGLFQNGIERHGKDFWTYEEVKDRWANFLLRWPELTFSMASTICLQKTEMGWISSTPIGEVVASSKWRAAINRPNQFAVAQLQLDLIRDVADLVDISHQVFDELVFCANRVSAEKVRVHAEQLMSYHLGQLVPAKVDLSPLCL